MQARGTITVYLESLGCAKNLVDSEVMLGFLARSGYRFVSNQKQADIIIINTCAFIREATAESCAAVRHAAEQKKTGACAHLIVCGCLPQRYGQQLAEEFPAVDIFLGTGEIHKIAAHLSRLRHRRPSVKVRLAQPSFLMTARTPRIITTPGASAYVKIAEGCSHHCTYCTIPAIRGPHHARSVNSILQEVRGLSRSGIREINLIAQDTTGYPELTTLLQNLVQIPGLAWIRLLYCHPRNLSPALISLIAREEKICKYIDLPLQHIADPILKRMGRRTSRRQLESLIGAVRRACPDIALRTTMMVGFPGERERDFEELLNFVACVRFDHLGAFEYRDEAGTPAARLNGRVPDKVKRERYDRLMRLQAGVAKSKNRARLGQEVRVLVENRSMNKKYSWQARAEFQAPEVDGVVFLNGTVAVGSHVSVRLVKALTYDLVGKVVSPG